MPVIPLASPAAAAVVAPVALVSRRRVGSEQTAQTDPSALCSDSDQPQPRLEFAMPTTGSHAHPHTHIGLHQDKMMTTNAMHMQTQQQQPQTAVAAARMHRSGGLVEEKPAAAGHARSRKSSLDLLEQTQLIHTEDAKRLSPMAASAVAAAAAAAGKRVVPLAAAAVVSGASLRPASRGPSPAPGHPNSGGGGMHGPSRSMGGCGGSGVEAAYAELKRRSRAPSLDGLGLLPSLASVVPPAVSALPARPQPARITHHIAGAGATVRAWQAAEDFNAPRPAFSASAAAAAAAADSLVSPRAMPSRPLQASSRTRPSSPHRASPLQVQSHGAPSPVDEKLLSPHQHRSLHARSASGRLSPTHSLPPLAGQMVAAAAVSSACSSPALRARRLSIGGGGGGGSGGFREAEAHAPPRMSFSGSSSAAIKARPVKPLPLDLPLGVASDSSACHSGVSSSQPSPNGSSTSAVAASMMMFRAGGSVASSPTASCVSTPASATSFSAGLQMYALKSPPHMASAAPIPTATGAATAASAFAASSASKAATARAYAFLRNGGGSSLNASPNVTPNLQTRQLARLEARAADSLHSSPALMARRLSVQPQPLQSLGSLTPRLEHLQRRPSLMTAAAAAASAASSAMDEAADSHSPLRSLGLAKHARGLSLSVMCGEGFLAAMPALSHHAAGTASASPVSSSSDDRGKSQSHSLSPASASSSSAAAVAALLARSAPSSGSVRPSSSRSRVGRAASDDVSVPMSPLSMGIAPLAEHLSAAFEEDMPVLATETLSDLPLQPQPQAPQPQAQQQRQRRPMVAPILLVQATAALSPVSAAALATAIESIPSSSPVSAPLVAPVAASVATIAASAVAVPAAAAAPASATPLSQPRRRFLPPPITLPVDVPDEESTPLTASPASDEEDETMSPSPICSPDAAAAASAFIAASAGVTDSVPSFVLPSADLAEGGVSSGSARHDRKASLGMLSRRGRFDDEDSDAVLLRDVQAATRAASSPPAAASVPTATLSSALPSPFIGLGICADLASFVLPDAPRASFSNYARAVLDEASLDSPAIQPSPLSPRSRAASDDPAQEETRALANNVAAAAAAAAEASPAPYGEGDVYEDGDDEEQDDAVDFWEAMDSGAYRLF